MRLLYSLSGRQHVYGAYIVQGVLQEALQKENLALQIYDWPVIARRHRLLTA